MKQFMFVFAVVVTSPAFAGTSMIGPPDPVIDCEFYLTNEDNIPRVLNWIKGALAPLTQADQAFTGYSPKAPAFAALGLPTPYPAGTVMKIEAPMTEQEPYWIKIFAQTGEELARFPFHVPPLSVWKQIKDIEADMETLAPDLGREDPNKISVGAVIGNFPGGRKFISIRRRMPNLVTVAVGVDIDLRLHQAFTEAITPHFVGTPAEEVLSRIEVIKAHFRIPAPPPKRRGGPGRIT